MKTIGRWRRNASKNKNCDTRPQGYRVRKLRPACQHPDAREAQEAQASREAEAEQAKSLAFSLSASLAFRSLSLLALPSQALPRQAASRNLGAHESEALCVRQLTPVV